MKNIASTIIIALAVIVSTTILVSGYKNRNTQNETISVTGLGAKDFSSDLIVWSGSFGKIDKDLKTAYSLLEADKKAIAQYLLKKGVDKTEIVFTSVDMDKDYDHYYDRKDVRHTVFIGYTLRQSVTIESKDVDRIEKISREITEIINEGIEFKSRNPRYYYTGLKELKLEMIAEATSDAYKRAEQIAENAGSGIDELKQANMGVFQITGQHSSENYSWGGTYNTSSREKTASITMKLQFTID